MLQAIHFKNIVENVENKFKTLPITISMLDSVDTASRDAMAKMNKGIKKHSLIGVLFCSPNTNFCKNEILDNLNFFHHSSADAIDFYCCGYGANWPEQEYLDQKVVTKINGTDWQYSDEALVDVIQEFETSTEWKYSGEAELLLLDVSPSNNSSLNINNAIVCNLEKMQKDKAFSSVRAFIQNLIRYASSDDNANAWKLSDKQGGTIAVDFLKDTLIGLLPKTLQSSYRKAENFAIRKI
ncbi:hypothetical protein YH65_05480 [Sulfurovum lithotrophicum]|uniref:Uncharacterized protein n=1 Tax=Sulfurovum lithotrophicum TaxID=206403 RepID=A0A7U4M125_9BACT|nr:hypothetical protein [Sulfurovum lithotrophicum]AKF24901.1 hypothetical protein YH65_05480 [Sulfurovum lithotrophicum]